MRDIIRRGERVTSLFPAQGEKAGVDAPPAGDARAGKPSPARNAGAVLEALRASSRAAQKARGESKIPAEGRREISNLSDRIRETDAMLADLRANPPHHQTFPSTRPQPQTGSNATTGPGRQREGNSELFRAQGVRLSAIETQVDEQTRRLQVALEDLGTRLDKRFDAMERHLASVREHAQELRSRDLQWAQRKLARLGTYVGIALCILTLVTFSLFGLNWWRMNDSLGRTEGSVHREISRLSGDLTPRLAHLEQDATDVEQGVDRVAGLVSRLNGQIAGLSKEQAHLSRRLDAVTTNPSGRKSRPTPSPAEKAGGRDSAAAATERYAIQLIGFRAKASVVSFARRFRLKGEARYLKVSDRGKHWYFVLLGDYTTYDEAAAAEKGLPQNLKDLKPRIRSITPGTNLTPIDGQ
jgi:DNA-binding transcriptional ArsR family regulator